MKLAKENWLQEKPKDENLLDYVFQFRTRLTESNEMARENLRPAKRKMKNQYDREVVERRFNAGDKVLVLLPIDSHPLKARYHGHYEKSKRPQLHFKYS